MNSEHPIIGRATHLRRGGKTHICCAICGRNCVKTRKGWFCAHCKAYSETDVEVDE